AALALVISLMNDRYLLLLQVDGKATDVLRFLRPFIIAIGIQSFTLIFTVAYRAVASAVPLRAEQAMFIVLSFFFVWSVGEVVAITRNLFAHAVVRAQEARTNDAEEQVRSIRQKRLGG